eukprot:TRINITY_DN280_c0_g2_i2.p1 TRINITY_DN280_c0_g2~~TRINITY_DN280_c0_g2_i2.p1  ORF type:complete len:321 (+),score=64.14 TRINITY_DN280_c0_g2_i2:73-1035(+)
MKNEKAHTDVKTLKTMALTAGATVAVAAGGLEVMDEAVAWTYGKCLEHGMPYLTNMYFEATLTYLVWFATGMYFTYLDVTRSPTKIQKDYWPTNWEMLSCAVPQIIVYGLGVVIGWVQWVKHPQEMSQVIQEAPPTFIEMIFQIVVTFLIFDFVMYWQHRALHTVPWLRNNIHSVHHVFSAPFGWAGGWVHPVEQAGLILGAAVPAYMICHPFARWWFFSTMVMILVDGNSGHSVWWSPFNWLIPGHGIDRLGNGAEVHDVHHYLPTKNFALILIVWDKVFGTYVDPDAENVPTNPYQPPYIYKFREEVKRAPSVTGGSE